MTDSWRPDVRAATCAEFSCASPAVAASARFAEPAAGPAVIAVAPAATMPSSATLLRGVNDIDQPPSQALSKRRLNLPTSRTSRRALPLGAPEDPPTLRSVAPALGGDGATIPHQSDSTLTKGECGRRLLTARMALPRTHR